MDDRHLSVELLRAVYRGNKSPGDLAIMAMSHLFEECPRCREAFEAWRQERGEGLAHNDGREYDEAFDKVKRRLFSLPDDHVGETHMESRAERSRDLAYQLAAELLALPQRKRKEKLKSDPARFTGPLLASAILEKGRQYLPTRPEEAYDAAGLARVVLQQGRPDALTSELYARALAHQANARRVSGELRQASEIFDVARFLLKTQGGGDRLIRAEIDSLEGSLRGAQRRLSEAESLFSRAIMAFAIEGEELDVSKTLVSLGVVYREMDDFERAIEVTNQAIDLLEGHDNPQLELMARHNLVTFLIQTGRIAEARELFGWTRPLYEVYPNPSTQLRRLWIEADLARYDGSIEEAATTYEAVRKGFVNLGLGYDAALVALDLATLYAEQGRTAELKKIAEEIVPVFEAQDVHREAAAALMLFQDAVRTEQVTLGYVLELTRYLQRARLDPALQFRVPT
jgi:tetratricopeptide (TPR) repeat protein